MTFAPRATRCWRCVDSARVAGTIYSRNPVRCFILSNAAPARLAQALPEFSSRCSGPPIVAAALRESAPLSFAQRPFVVLDHWSWKRAVHIPARSSCMVLLDLWRIRAAYAASSSGTKYCERALWRQKGSLCRSWRPTLLCRLKQVDLSCPEWPTNQLCDCGAGTGRCRTSFDLER